MGLHNWLTPHPPLGHLLPHGEKEMMRKPHSRRPSPLVGEGGSARRAETNEGTGGRK